MSPPEDLRGALRYDGEHLWWKNPTPQHKPGPVGTLQRSKTGKEYLRFMYKRRIYYCHAVIWWLLHGDWLEVDHKDGDGLNNKLNNLRPADRSQNNCNKAGRASTGHKGIYELKPGYYQATVRLKGKAHNKCGTNLDELVAWVRAKREEIHGAYVNHDCRPV